MIVRIAFALWSNTSATTARSVFENVSSTNRFESEIMVEKDGETVNGKSIMGLMMLAAGPGSKLHVRASGPDASQAVNELEQLLKRKFDED